MNGKISKSIAQYGYRNIFFFFYKLLKAIKRREANGLVQGGETIGSLVPEVMWLPFYIKFFWLNHNLHGQNWTRFLAKEQKTGPNSVHVGYITIILDSFTFKASEDICLFTSWYHSSPHS